MVGLIIVNNWGNSWYKFWRLIGVLIFIIRKFANLMDSKNWLKILFVRISKIVIYGKKFSDRVKNSFILFSYIHPFIFISLILYTKKGLSYNHLLRITRATQICGIIIYEYKVLNNTNIILYVYKSILNMVLYTVIYI